MAHIEINDLNEEVSISETEMKHVNGGYTYDFAFKTMDLAGSSTVFNKSTPILMDEVNYSFRY